MKKNMMKLIDFFIITILLIGCLGANYTSNAETYNQVTINDTNTNNNGIEAFPDSYQILLNKLVDQTGYTNWKFKAFYTDIDWNEFVSKETNCLHNTVYKGNDSNWYDSCGKQGDTGYYCASKEITSYYMDPRNFLTEITIFQFLDLSNSSPVTVAQISNAVKGTYLEGSVNGDSYAQMIYDAAKESGESAFSILVRIFQELGNGTSLPDMISGNNSTYPNTYNFFNYGATDGEGNLARGLAYAQQAGWTTPRKALVEGAKLIAGTYTKAGQVNKYLYKFDVVGSSSSELFTHQYMTNIQDPNTQASTLYDRYNNNNLLEEDLTFVIPIFKNMPTYVKLPGKETGNLYYVSSVSTGVGWRNSDASYKGELKKDTVVTMIQENATTINGLKYGKISYQGNIGYMAMKYLTPVNTVKDTYVVPGTGTEYLGSDKNSAAQISYSVKIEDSEWTNWGKDGETIGTIGKNKQLELLKVSLGDSSKALGIKYKVHVQDIGWMDWISNDEVAGSTNASKQIEAVQIKLQDSTTCDVSYRVYAQEEWSDWKKNGTIAGTTGAGIGIEAIQIKLEYQSGKQYIGDDFDSSSQISYSAQLQDIGWTNWGKDGETIGTTSRSKRLETVQIKLGDDFTSLGVQYKVHVQDIGWMDWTSEGESAGTVGKSKRIEAIEIKLKDASKYNIKYRVYVEDYGWMEWVYNGNIAGTVGEEKRIEAIEIKLEKNENINPTGVEYKVHVQDIGWTNLVSNGALSGTTGKAKRLEAIRINLTGLDTKISDAIRYKVHVQDIGWTNWVSNGEMAGTEGKAKRLEAIQIELNSMFSVKLKYRVHVQDIGWTNWVSNGEIAGTVGKAKRLEAIEIKIEE